MTKTKEAVSAMLGYLQNPPESMVETAQGVHESLVMVQSKLCDLQNAKDEAKARECAKVLREELDSLLEDTHNLAEQTETLEAGLESVERELGIEVL